MKFRDIRVYASVLALALLAACGSGNNEATTPPPGQPQPTSQLQAYAGTWKECEVGTSMAMGQGPLNSSQSVFVINAPSANGSVTGTITDLHYTSLDCTGNPFATVTINRILTFVANGTKTIAGNASDRLDVAASAGTTTATGANITTDATDVIVTPPGGVPTSYDLNLIAVTFRGVGRVSGNTFQLGTEAPFDTDNYPRGFESTFTKQ
jgi:hypothetical protein